MGVKEIQGEADWDFELNKAGDKLVVADFSATWCGPCKLIKPTFQQYSNTYPDVIFLSVDEAANRSLIQSLGIKGFPTFHFYIKKIKRDELVGADSYALKSKIENLRGQVFNAFAGGGVVLGAPSGTIDPRSARLKRFENKEKEIENNDNIELSEEEELKKAIELSQQSMPTIDDGKNAKQTKTVVVCDGDTCTLKEVPNNDDVIEISEENKGLLSQLTEMGFSEDISRKSIQSGGNNIEKCIAWIEENNSSNNDSSSDTKDITPLTEEMRKAKEAQLKQKIQERRLLREKEEKENEIKREIERRKAGKDISETRDEIETIQRKRELEKRKKERLDAKLERQRLLRELEKDKLERKLHGGKLTGTFIDYNEANKDDGQTNTNALDKIMNNIQMLTKFKESDAGLIALKTLSIYLKNLVKNPEEDKFYSINLQNAAFKKKVSCLRGGISLLKNIGYERKEDENMIVLDKSKRNDEIIDYANKAINEAIERWKCI